ncbi:DUF3040 domain-containing protein [Herbiconiux sp. L3-i23]|uniref:DUF3040 domain-containing protein n=1 Tax=Herbiconiux sp. L3-i23 TaxID=2905871 RepID=UPI00206ECEFA|nr:DUF3040 domain-containing protein [Herbiconiux sp. L3-i23]BDI22394.1 hypothetical protein L3i23_11700 [Herbiconiux sp. L3-i23]
MPLSEQEQRLLDEMERSLYQNDAEFVASVARAQQGRRSYTWLVAGVVVALAGIAVLVLGVVFQQPLIGILGFVVMFGGVLLALGSPRKPLAAGSGSKSSRKRSGSGSGFMSRMNDRWDRRQGGNS